MSCYRTIRLQNFKDKESLFQKDAAKVQLFIEIRKWILNVIVTNETCNTCQLTINN